MISSMTGFGKGEADANGWRFSVEIRTVNGRYGDVSVHLPRYLSEIETRVKDLVLEFFSRGRIDVSISAKGAGGRGQGLPQLNEEVLTAYLSGFDALKAQGAIPGSLTLEGVAGLPNVFSFELPELDVEVAWDALDTACRTAASACVDMRRTEGKSLSRDLEARIGHVEALVAKVEGLAPQRTETTRKRLEEKLQSLISPDQVDEGRLLTEIALIAERGDITEECVRFHSHNSQFASTLGQGDGAGRKLNFLLQEMLREANTIGSKASDADLAHLVVEIKEEIEKLKEQVLNVE